MPGFASITADEPDEDLYLLNEASDVEFVLLAIDPGAGIISFPNPMVVGDTLLLGPPFFDAHPLWNISSGKPGEVFSVTLMLRDRSHVLADSEPFVVTLTPASCAGDVNDDGVVNTLDLTGLLAYFGQKIAHGEPGHDADLNHDGVVNTQDLTILLSHFGQPC